MGYYEAINPQTMRFLYNIHPSLHSEAVRLNRLTAKDDCPKSVALRAHEIKRFAMFYPVFKSIATFVHDNRIPEVCNLTPCLGYAALPFIESAPSECLHISILEKGYGYDASNIYRYSHGDTIPAGSQEKIGIHASKCTVKGFFHDKPISPIHVNAIFVSVGEIGWPQRASNLGITDWKPTFDAIFETFQHAIIHMPKSALPPQKDLPGAYIALGEGYDHLLGCVSGVYLFTTKNTVITGYLD